MPVQFSTEEPTKPLPAVSFSTEEPVRGPAIGIPKGFEPEQIEKVPSSVKFSTEEQVSPPSVGIKETSVNVAKGLGRGIMLVAQLPGQALKWAAEANADPDGTSNFKKIFSKNFLGRIPAPDDGEPMGQYVGKSVEEFLPDWEKNIDSWSRRATKKFGQNVVDYYKRGLEGGLLSDTPAFAEARKWGWTTAPVQKALVATAESSPQYVAALTAGLITKNPQVPLAMMGAMTAAQSYGQLRDEGVEPDLAGEIAVLQGAWEAATEKVPFDMIFTPTSKGLLKRFLKIGTVESFQELIQNTGQNYLNHIGENYDPAKPETLPAAAKIEMGELFNGWFESMSAGFLMGGGAALATGLGPRQAHIIQGMESPKPVDDINVIQDIKQEIQDNTTLTPEEKETGLLYIGDIETKIVKKIVDKYPEPVHDGPTATFLTHKLAKDLGLPDPEKYSIQWLTGRKQSHGTWAHIDRRTNVITIVAESPNLAGLTTQVWVRPGFWEKVPNETPGQPNQKAIRMVLVHELGHNVKPPYRTDTGRKIAHHKAFVNWVAENVRSLYVEQKKALPVRPALIPTKTGPGNANVPMNITRQEPSEITPPTLPQVGQTPEGPTQTAQERQGKTPSDSIVETHNANGGSTINLTTGKPITEGFAVAISKDYEKVIPGDKLTKEQLDAYKSEHQDVLDADPRRTIGTWVDNGKTYLDISTVLPTEKEAIEVGKQNNQLAIFDLKTFTTIPIETKGMPVGENENAIRKAKKERLRQIAKEVNEKYIPEQKARGGLTLEEGKEFAKLAAEAQTIRFELHEPLDISKVLSQTDRKSNLPSEIVQIANSDLFRNKDVYDVITSASSGVQFNAFTAVDRVLQGKSGVVNRQQLYAAFNDTRAALRKQFGSAIKLYRAVGEQIKKPATNWASTKELAQQYGDKIIEKNVPVDNVLAVNVGNGKYEEFIVADQKAISTIKTELESLPAGEQADTGEKKTGLSRKRALVLGHTIPNLMGWDANERIDFMRKLTGKTSMKDMSLEEMRKVVEAMQAESKAKGFVFEAAEKETPVEELLIALKESHPKQTKLGYNPPKMRKLVYDLQALLQKGGDIMRLPLRMFDLLDGGKDGPWHKRIFQPLMDQSAFARINTDVEIKELATFFQENKINADEYIYKATEIPGTKHKLTTMERLGVYGLSENEAGFERLLNADFTDADIKAIRKSVTPEEKKVLDFCMKKFEEQWVPLVNAAVQAGWDVSTLKKELSYVPIENQDSAYKQDFIEELADFSRTEARKPDSRMLLQRVPGAKGRMNLDLAQLYFNNATRVQRFIAMAPLAKQLRSIMHNSGIVTELNGRTFGQGTKLLNEYIATKIRGGLKPETSGFENIMAWLRHKGTTFAAARNVLILMRQTLSLCTTMADDPSLIPYVMKHAMDVATKGGVKNLAEFVTDSSLYMKDRALSNNVQRYFNLKSVSKALAEQNFDYAASKWYVGIDKLVANIAWKSYYEFSMDKLNPGDIKAALIYADERIQKTQSLIHTEDLSMLYKGGELSKNIVAFTREMATLGNYWYYDIYQAKASGEIGWGKAGYRVMMSYMIPALLFGMISRGRPQRTKKELLTDALIYLAGPSIFLGGLVNRLMTGLDSGLISFSVFDSLYGVIQQAKKLPNWENMSDEQKSDTVHKLMKKSAMTIGGLTGKLSAQDIRTIEGAWDLYRGNTADPRRLIWSDYGLNKGPGTEQANEENTYTAGRK